MSGDGGLAMLMGDLLTLRQQDWPGKNGCLQERFGRTRDREGSQA
jgi:thiamine pyrophosphate-dependent acetolactate synthase large subunit-like protein